jgi:hypothetical protein
MLINGADGRTLDESGYVVRSQKNADLSMGWTMCFSVDFADIFLVRKSANTLLLLSKWKRRAPVTPTLYP